MQNPLSTKSKVTQNYDNPDPGDGEPDDLDEVEDNDEVLDAFVDDHDKDPNFDIEISDDQKTSNLIDEGLNPESEDLNPLTKEEEEIHNPVDDVLKVVINENSQNPVKDVEEIQIEKPLNGLKDPINDEVYNNPTDEKEEIQHPMNDIGDTSNKARDPVNNEVLQNPLDGVEELHDHVDHVEEVGISTFDEGSGDASVEVELQEGNTV